MQALYLLNKCPFMVSIVDRLFGRNINQQIFRKKGAYRASAGLISMISPPPLSGEALYSQQKQDRELTVARIVNSLLPNSVGKVGKTT